MIAGTLPRFRASNDFFILFMFLDFALNTKSQLVYNWCLTLFPCFIDCHFGRYTFYLTLQEKWVFSQNLKLRRISWKKLWNPDLDCCQFWGVAEFWIAQSMRKLKQKLQPKVKMKGFFRSFLIKASISSLLMLFGNLVRLTLSIGSTEMEVIAWFDLILIWILFEKFSLEFTFPLGQLLLFNSEFSEPHI